MRIRRVAFRTANRILGAAGFRIDQVGYDFDGRLAEGPSLKRLFAFLADPFREWISSQNLFEPRLDFDIEKAVADFYSCFLHSPFRSMAGGSRFNNLLWLHLITKSYRPSLIVDSGTYEGASAWAMSLAAPEAEQLSFDPDMSRLLLRVPGVRYVESDWMDEDLSARDWSRALAYFDDHVDQAKRLIEASDRGVQLAVFDDDYPVTCFAAQAHGGFSVPKVEFVLDDELRREKSLSWYENGRLYTWPVDTEYLDRARAVIAKTERLPNTSQITGIHQTPYRVVQIAKTAAA